MPVTIDIREDLRYQQGVEEGIKKESSRKLTGAAKKMLQDGVATKTIQNWTGLEISEIEKIAKELFKG